MPGTEEPSSTPQTSLLRLHLSQAYSNALVDDAPCVGQATLHSESSHHLFSSAAQGPTRLHLKHLINHRRQDAAEHLNSRSRSATTAQPTSEARADQSSVGLRTARTLGRGASGPWQSS